jgi:transposase
MKALSLDLRQRVLAAVDRGLPRAEVAQTFQVSLSTIKRYLTLRRETGRLAPRPRSGRPSIKGAALRAALRPQLETHPDATLAEHCARWAADDHPPVSTATMSRAIQHHFRWTRKKSRSRQPSGTRRPGPPSGSASAAAPPKTSSLSTKRAATST